MTTRADFFTAIYRDNGWRGKESRSGQGSDLFFAQEMIATLPKLLRRYDVNKFLDVPCGDFHWMQRIDFGLTYYTGGDIVQDAIDDNNARYATNRRRFVLLDIVKDDLPNADMIFIRDCFIHFTDDLVHQALNNIVRSDIKYLCLTHCVNFDVLNGDLERAEAGVNHEFRPINFELPPYSFPPPLEVLQDGVSFEKEKVMAVWEIEAIRKAICLSSE